MTTKNYVKDWAGVKDFTYIPARDALDSLQKQLDWYESQGWINLQYESPGYDADLYLYGDRPMTQGELKVAERRRQTAKKASATRKQKLEESQRQQYEKLKEKFG